MQIQAHENSVKTNAKVNTQTFSIDDDATVIFDILQNKLYEKKIESLTREVISNSRDAMRESGKFDNAFEVTIPTRLSPTFKVRDFGPGITPDRMSNVFIKYGASSKRKDNTQTGGWGVGAKSPFSYSDSFSIVTWIDGTKRCYVAHIGENKRGNLDLISTESTTERNGTEIQVPVKADDCSEFRDAVFRATYFWDKKPIIKGELNPPVLVRGTRISDLVEVISNDDLPSYVKLNSYSDEVLAIIDGIPYTVSGNLVRKIEKLKDATDLLDQELILHFGNGVVQVSASREKIDDSPFTVTNLEKLAEQAHQAIEKHIVDAFAKAKTATEYLKTYSQMSESFKVDKYAKFETYSINSGWIEAPALKAVRITTISNLNRRGQKSDKLTRRDLTDGQKHIEVKEFDRLYYTDREESKVLRNKRLRAYMQNHSRITIIEKLAGNGAFFDKIVRDLSLKSFHDITFVEEPKAERQKGIRVKRENASICLHGTGEERFIHTTLAENTQKYFYVALKDGQWPSSLNAVVAAELNRYLWLNKQAKVVGVTGKVLDMVKSDPNFESLQEWLDGFKPNRAMISNVKNLLATNQSDIDRFKKMDLNDKFIEQMVEEYRDVVSSGFRVPAILLEKVKTLPEVKEFIRLDAELGKLITKTYPLFGQVYGSLYDKDLVVYMNAVYKNNK